MKIIISDDELKDKMRLPLPSLLENGNLKLPDIVVPPELGRPEGSTNKDQVTKEIIALDGAFGSNGQKAIARIHGVTQPEVSFLSKGFDRTNVDTRQENEELKTTINQVKHKIVDRATCKLMEALDIFEPSALDQKQLPSAMVSVASVIERMENKGPTSAIAPVNFHIYAPRTRHEDQYEVIQVNE